MIDLTQFFRKTGASSNPQTVEIAGGSDWNTPSFKMLACDGRDQVACTAAARRWQQFEQPMPAVLRILLTKTDPGIFVDVGANTGFYSLLALAASSQTTVVAYEPLSSVRKILRQNLALNKVPLKTASRAKISPRALSDEAGRARLFVPDKRHGLIETSASLCATFKESLDGYETVKRTTLDAEFRKTGPVAIVKVDA